MQSDQSITFITRNMYNTKATIVNMLVGEKKIVVNRYNYRIQTDAKCIKSMCNGTGESKTHVIGFISAMGMVSYPLYGSVWPADETKTISPTLYSPSMYFVCLCLVLARAPFTM